MKPTHAQLVNLLREIVWASPQVLPELLERARQVLCLRDAALRAPAVTGAAELPPRPPRPPMPEPDAVPGLPRYGVTWQGGKNEPLLTPMPDGYWTPWHLAAAPPAAGAPPALVARSVADTLKRVRDAYADSHGEDFAAWLAHEVYDACLTADLTSHAPAPVAPPAETSRTFLSGETLAALDPGIRDLVNGLNVAGFTTTDSGDGCSKAAAIAAGEALPFRHVACAVSRDALFSEADRLLAVLGAGWTVEASYHPPEGQCLLFASEDVADERRQS